jgi:uncharacterized LabA/DUF88 family protein
MAASPVNPPRNTSPQEIKYLFIDGGCLQAVLGGALKKFFDSVDVKAHIDYSKIGIGFTKIFYYDCLPAQINGESDANYVIRENLSVKFFNNIRMLNGWHVYEGILKRRKNRGNEQKQVDVMLAVDMLTHSFRKNMHSATLLASDLDFRPLIDALVYEGMKVSLWYPHGETNEELIFAADVKSKMTLAQAYSWTSDAFQRDNHLPEDFSIYKTDFAEYEQEVEYELTQGGDLVLYKNLLSSSFGVIFSDIYGQKIGFKYNDLEKLKFFISQIVEVDWNTPRVK